MIRLVFKNNFFSLRGSSQVKDENGQPRFVVQGKVLSWGRKKSVQTLDGKELYVVINKAFTLFFGKCYIRDPQGNVVAFVRRRLKFFGDRFTVESPDGDLEIKGDIINREYEVIKAGKPIGEIKQHVVTLRDGFTLTAYEDRDAAFLVALVTAVDNIYDHENM